MSLRLKIFIIGSCVVTLLVAAVFLFIPKEKPNLILDEPLVHSQAK